MGDVIDSKTVPWGYEPKNPQQKAFVKWSRRPGLPGELSKEQLAATLSALEALKKRVIEGRDGIEPEIEARLKACGMWQDPNIPHPEDAKWDQEAKAK